jgi:hypothetical protein
VAPGWGGGHVLGHSEAAGTVSRLWAAGRGLRTDAGPRGLTPTSTRVRPRRTPPRIRSDETANPAVEGRQRFLERRAPARTPCSGPGHAAPAQITPDFVSPAGHDGPPALRADYPFHSLRRLRGGDAAPRAAGCAVLRARVSTPSVAATEAPADPGSPRPRGALSPSDDLPRGPGARKRGCYCRWRVRPRTCTASPTSSHTTVT